MAINYIKGDILAANLERSTDLAIETDLLYFDVLNGRLGVKTSTPATILDVGGDITSSGLLTSVSAAVGNIALANNTLSTSSGNLILSPATNNVEVSGNMEFTAATGIITGGSDSLGNNAQPALTISTAYVDTPYFLDRVPTDPGVAFAAIAAANGLYMTPDGSTVFYVDSSGGGTAPVDVYQTSLSTVYDLATAGVATFTTITGGAGTEAAHGITFNPNGLEMYISKYNTNVGAIELIVEKFTLSIAFDLTSTITYIGNIVIADNDLFNFAPVVSSDGLKAYISGIDTLGQIISEYTLSTAYDLTSATFINNYNMSVDLLDTSNYIASAISEDGTTIFAAQYDTTSTTNVIVKYKLNTPYDITTATLIDSVSPATAGEARAFIFSKDTGPGTIGFRMQWLGNDGKMYAYDTKNVAPTNTSTVLNYNGQQSIITNATGTTITGSLTFSGTDPVIVQPAYSTALLPTPIQGGTVYDLTTKTLKVADGSAWNSIGSPGGVALEVLTADTTDGTTTEALQYGTPIVLLDNSTWRFEANVVARRTDATGENVGYKFTGVIARDVGVGTTTIIGSVAEVIDAEDTAAVPWFATVDADTGNGSLRIQVTGEAGKTIKWVVFVRIVKVTN